MLKPISKRLMPDSMTVREPADGDYGGVFAEPYKVANVRFDANIPLMRLDYALEDGTRGIVFVDAVNSGVASEIPVGSLVTIRGDQMEVAKVHRFEGFNGETHHWELEVR